MSEKETDTDKSKKKTDTNKLASMAFDDALNRLAHTDPKELSDISKETIADSAIDKLVANFEDVAQLDDTGIEFWYARDLQRLLGYGSSWQNFSKVIDKAKLACESSGHKVIGHFNDVIKKAIIYLTNQSISHSLFVGVLRNSRHTRG